MCIECYKKVHPKVVIPGYDYSDKIQEYCCDNCVDGVSLMYSKYIFPQLSDGYSVTDKQIQFENLYCLECTFCNDAKPSQCFNCKEEYYNQSPLTNNRCLICIWLHNKPLPKEEAEEYYPTDMFTYISKLVLDEDMIKVRGCSYMKADVKTFGREAFLRLMFSKKEERQKEAKQKGTKKEQKLPFGYTLPIKKNKRNRNKNNKK